MSKRPNILFIFADQMRYDALGAVNPAINTPNLDRLAASGMLLTRAYAPTPVCLPCRASVLTGQYTSTNRAAHNHSRLPEDYSPLISALLAKQGYFTHMIGKSHLACCHDPASPESAPHIHNRAYFKKWHGPWYGFERADIAIGHTTEKHACGMHYGAWLEEQGVDIARYFGHTEYTQYGAWDLPEEYHSSKWVADVTIDSIERCAEEERPFFIWANFQDPHNPCMVPEPWASMYKPEEMPAHGFKPGEPECFAQKPPFYREILAQPGDYAAKPSDPDMRGAGNVCHLDWTDQQIRENAACYYGMVSLMDKHIGRILDALEEAGELENTLIVFTADHGDLLGDHGFWFKSLVSYEESIRVPMIVSYPGHIPAGARSDALQNLVDLAPTFLSYANASIPVEIEGVDQRSTWESGVPVRQETVVEERPYHSNFSERFIITPTHKLGFYAGREHGELYDTVNDPHQIHNLWDSPEHAALKQELIVRLLTHEITKVRPRLSHSEEYALNSPHREGVKV